MTELKEARFIRFVDEPNPGKKTRRITVVNKSGGYPLGRFLWHGPWRQYVFEPVPETIFNVECLGDLADRMGYLNTMHGRAALAAPNAPSDASGEASPRQVNCPYCGVTLGEVHGVTCPNLPANTFGSLSPEITTATTPHG